MLGGSGLGRGLRLRRGYRPIRRLKISGWKQFWSKTLLPPLVQPILSTGHATLPRTMAMVCSALSWSFLLCRMVTLNPSSLSSRSSTVERDELRAPEGAGEADQ
jgi:hypothetical protein